MRTVRVPGTLQLHGNDLVVTFKFSVAPADYQIKIPVVVRNSISKTGGISATLTCPAASVSTASR